MFESTYGASKSWLILEQGDYNHFLGGNAFDYTGIYPKKSKQHVHLVMSLDISDPLLPFESSQLKALPLFYPFKFNGAEMTYCVKNNGVIEILYIDDDEVEDDFPYDNYPETFPKVAFSLKEMTYEEYKIVIFKEVDILTGLSDGDSEILEGTPYPNYTRFSGEFPSVSGRVTECLNRACDYFGDYSPKGIITIASEFPAPGISFWDNDCVGIAFEFCRSCMAISTYNLST